jgi:uncharacterized membrane protein
VNPFDLKTVLLAKHAQHVVLIHFPIALFLAGVAFDFIAERTRNAALAAAAYYNFMVAAAAVLPVLVTGLLAWQFALGGVRLRGLLLLHLLLGLIVAVLIWLVARVHYRWNRKQLGFPSYRWPIEGIAAVLIVLTAHLGGFLSGVNVGG